MAWDDPSPPRRGRAARKIAARDVRDAAQLESLLPSIGRGLGALAVGVVAYVVVHALLMFLQGHHPAGSSDTWFHKGIALIVALVAVKRFWRPNSVESTSWRFGNDWEGPFWNRRRRTLGERVVDGAVIAAAEGVAAAVEGVIDAITD